MAGENTQPVPETEPKPEAEVVSSGTLLAGETVLKPETPPAGPTQPQYLTKEEAASLIADAVRQGRDTGRREMQSEKDREVAVAIRRQRQLEAENASLNAGFNTLDPETRQGMELEQYKARERSQKQLEAEETSRRVVEETVNQFTSNLSEYARDVGVDPTHKALDWGSPNESLTVRQNKFLKSVAKIQKEQTKAKEDAISTRLRDEVAKARKELGLESVDQTPSAVTGGSADFIKKFAAGDIPMTKENIAKYNKSLEE